MMTFLSLFLRSIILSLIIYFTFIIVTKFSFLFGDSPAIMVVVLGFSWAAIFTIVDVVKDNRDDSI